MPVAVPRALLLALVVLAGLLGVPAPASAALPFVRGARPCPSTTTPTRSARASGCRRPPTPTRTACPTGSRSTWSGPRTRRRRQGPGDHGCLALLRLLRPRQRERAQGVRRADGVISKAPLFYDNYFVPRGYAFAAVDLSGTNRSTGCEDVGGPAEVAGARAAVDWLNGRAKGFSADGTPVSARSWTTGKVGMIGKSWDGSVANGVAATGVRGLETIVPISAISSWYDYMRYNGSLRASGYPNYLQRVGQRPAHRAARR